MGGRKRTVNNVSSKITKKGYRNFDFGVPDPQKDRQDVPKRCLEGIGRTPRESQHEKKKKTGGKHEKLKNDDFLNGYARF